MTELLAHLVGDYVLQSHTMALYKTSESKWALIHVFFYGLLESKLRAMGAL